MRSRVRVAEVDQVRLGQGFKQPCNHGLDINERLLDESRVSFFAGQMPVPRMDAARPLPDFQAMLHLSQLQAVFPRFAASFHRAPAQFDAGKTGVYADTFPIVPTSASPPRMSALYKCIAAYARQGRHRRQG